MLWNFTMTKKESSEENKIKDITHILKNKFPLKIKYNNFFHLTERKTYSKHDNFICTNILLNKLSLNIYLALKNNSTGEGYIFDKKNNIYLKAHFQIISKLLINFKQNHLISCSYDKYIKIWDISKNIQKIISISLLKGHKGRIYDMELIEDKQKLLSCGMDKNILLWDIEKFVLIKNITITSSFHNLFVKYLSYDSNSNELILVYSKNAIINIVNIDDNKIFDTIAIGLKAEPIIFINNQECIYQNSKNLFLIIYNFINKTIVGELKGCINNILILYKIDLMNKIISFDKGNDIRIWNLNKNFCELCIKVDFVLYCLYVNNEGELFCGSLNKTLIYD